MSLRWRHNDHPGVSNHQPHGCLLNRLFRRRWKKTSKLRVTGLCAGNSPGPVNSPHKGPVTRKMFLFDDVIVCVTPCTRNTDRWVSPSLNDYRLGMPDHIEEFPMSRTGWIFQNGSVRTLIPVVTICWQTINGLVLTRLPWKRTVWAVLEYFAFLSDVIPKDNGSLITTVSL